MDTYGGEAANDDDGVVDDSIGGGIGDSTGGEIGEVIGDTIGVVIGGIDAVGDDGGSYSP